MPLTERPAEACKVARERGGGAIECSDDDVDVDVDVDIDVEKRA